MRLLFLTEYYPGPRQTVTGGVEARTWQITTALAERHDVTVVTSWRGAEEPRQTIEGRLRVLRVGPPYPYSNSGYVFKRLGWAIGAFRAARRIDTDLVEG